MATRRSSRRSGHGVAPEATAAGAGAGAGTGVDTDNATNEVAMAEASERSGGRPSRRSASSSRPAPLHRTVSARQREEAAAVLAHIADTNTQTDSTMDEAAAAATVEAVDSPAVEAVRSPPPKRKRRAPTQSPPPPSTSAVAVAAASFSAAAAAEPTRRGTSRQAANPKLAVRSYAYVDIDEDGPDIAGGHPQPASSPSGGYDSDDPMVGSRSSETEDEGDAYLVESDESVEASPSTPESDDDGDEFVLAPQPKKKKRKVASAMKKPQASTPKPRTSKKQPHPTESKEAEELEDLSDAVVDDVIAEPTTKKKPTAAQRRKSAVLPSRDDAAPSASQEARDASFRAFAAAPSPTRNKVNAPRLPRSSAASSTREILCIDDDEIMEIAPFTSNKMPRPSTASWNNIGLGNGSAIATSKTTKAKPASKSSILTADEKEDRIGLVRELLGGSSSVSLGDVTRYLDAANWSVEVALDRIMDSAWFQSSNGVARSSAAPSARVAPSTASAASAVARKPSAASRAAQAISIPDDSPPAAAASSSKEWAAAESTTPIEDLSLDLSLAHAPARVRPDWDRKLLLILNVTGRSITSGKGLLQTGDVIQFVRERFDPLGWSADQQDKQGTNDAAANAHAIAAVTGKKKPASSKLKGKANVIVQQAKKSNRILRFKRRDAQANSLEIGSVPQELTHILAPLFDAHFIDIESSVLYVAPVLDFFTTITLSVSVYVLSELFMWTPPRDALAQAPLTDNPFWKKIFAKKDAAAATGSLSQSHRWNPVEAFCTLMRECEVQPIASTEMELDGVLPPVAPTAPALAPPAIDVENGGSLDAVAAASSSSSAAPVAAAAAASSSGAAVISAPAEPVEPVYDEELEIVSASKGAPSADGGAPEITISRFQLDSLYASAAASSATIPEAEAPAGLKTQLRPYQRQALYWMKQREAGDDDLARASKDAMMMTDDESPEPVAVRRHALWDEYAFEDANRSRFYVNPFSNEISLQFPPSTGGCRGGLLCDEMGMGKTVMIIALLIANHPANLLLDLAENEPGEEQEDGTTEGLEEEKQGERASAVKAEAICIDDDEEAKEQQAPAAAAAASASAARPAAAASSSFFDSMSASRLKHRRKYMHHNGVSGCTLVLCPMSLLSQWRDEIAKFSDMNVLVYYGNARDRRKVDFADYDVVISSYGVVAAEYRAVTQAQVAANSAASGGHAAAAAPPLTQKAVRAISPLLGTHFFRIVLDEAHIIRNRSTETSKAVFQLRGDRRWAVSGTIIQNKLDDCYAPLLFLREEPWSSWGWWQTVISQPFEKQDPVALQRLRAILAPLMLRRTKSMRTATGESIVELPPRIDETLTCDFNEQERDFYSALYDRSRAQFEGFVSAGSVSTKYIQILTLLLRLRQCCDHPFLVLGRPSAKSDAEFDSDVNRFIHRFASRVDLRADGAPTISFLETLSSDLKKSARNGEERPDCSICLGPPEVPVLTECGHAYCRECTTPLFNERGLGRCPLCRSVISQSKLFLVPESTPAFDARAQWQHSSKTARLLEELRAIRAGPDPEAKVIIFSQWTTMLDLVEIALQTEVGGGFAFLRLDGALSQKERENVLRKFASENKARILLISLKAGGVGLNLVMANYCFFLDCWWNPSVEEQACQRVHRIGQQKTVYVKRFVVAGSVEERILELQEKKRCLAQSVSADAEEQKQVRVQDLVDLFKA